jgi:glycosyltransferase involved in cell wall biosynthesis
MERVSASIVLAAYNEGDTLSVVLERLLATLSAEQGFDWELIVVDDGSSDATPRVLREFSARQPGVLRTVTHPENRGLVAAMKTGAEAARNETVVYLDADLSYEPKIVERLLRAKSATGADVAIASPYMRGGRVANVPLDRLVASRGANWILSRCAGGRLHTFTGMVRAYDTALLRELFSKPVVGEFNTWAIAACIESGRRVVEVPAALVWPRERFEAPSRISPRKLLERAKLVLVTATYLAAACGASKRYKTGTLVLVEEPGLPYSLRS